MNKNKVVVQNLNYWFLWRDNDQKRLLDVIAVSFDIEAGVLLG